ncbi:hypothetical protein Tco_1319678 [Tanacetum coccineum]
MKAELLKLGLHNERNLEESASVLVNMTPLFKTLFPMAWRILMNFFIHVLGGNKSSTDQLTDKPRKKYVAYPRFLSCVLESLLGFDYTQDTTLGSTPSILTLVSPTPHLKKWGRKRGSRLRLNLNPSHRALRLQEYHLRKPRARSRPRPKSPPLNSHVPCPQDTVGNKQPAIMGPRENIQPTDMGLLSTPKDGIQQLPATNPNEGIRTSHLLPEGTLIDPKDSGRNIQLTDRGLPSTTVTDHLGANTKYQVEKTQSTRFEVSDPNHNKGKNSFGVEPDIQAPIQSFQDFEILMEDSEDDLKELSGEEFFEVGEKMEDAFPLNTKEASQPPHLLKRSSHLKNNPNMKNHLILTHNMKNQTLLNTNQQHLMTLSLNHPNNWEKYEEATASYADLKVEISGFHDVTFKAAENTDASIRNYERSCLNSNLNKLKELTKFLLVPIKCIFCSA